MRYHGVKQMVATSMYRVGLIMLDLDDPTKIIRRTPSWVLGPDAEYERVGDVPNVVFPTGLVHDEARDELRLYYGAADLCVAMASARFSEVVDYLVSLPPENEWPFLVGDGGPCSGPPSLCHYFGLLPLTTGTRTRLPHSVHEPS